MSNAARGAALARDSEPSSVEAVARTYVDAAGGDPDIALRLAIADALATFAEMEQRALQAEGLVSRGFVRGAFGPTVG
jgi:hypothetical protein